MSSKETPAGFRSQKIKDGLIYDLSRTMYPSFLMGFTGGKQNFEGETRTCYGVVLSGTVTLSRAALPSIGLAPGMYFACPGAFTLEASTAQVALMVREGYRGLFTVGGPVENTGRLVYIDDCSVSQLVPPVRLGDPTYQLLVFPPGVDQTRHIHPSVRLGVVLKGRGTCVSPRGREPLAAGEVFVLDERFPHAFATAEEPLMIVAYHPDSDVGPTDQEHPMLSRTYLRGDDGVSG